MFSFKGIFSPNHTKYDGIRPINIYLMRAIYLLMSVFLGLDAWGHIFSYEGIWQPSDAMDWSIWAAFALFAFIGLFRTVEMIPILLLEITYKVIWLILVALPLWQKGELSMDSADGMFFPFALVILPIIAVPWGYVFNKYILNKKAAAL